MSDDASILETMPEMLKPQSVKTTLRDAIKALADAAPNVLSTFVDLEKSSSVADLFSAYNQLRSALDMIGTICKVLNELEDTLSKKTLPDLMESMYLDMVKSKGYTYSVGIRTHANIPVDKRSEANTWLIEKGYGALINSTVNSKTLSSVIKTYIEEKGEKPPEDLIKVHQEKYISVRKVS